MSKVCASALFGSLVVALVGASAAEPPSDLDQAGAFGFPQDEATVVWDTDDLRVSAWNEADHLYIQAVVWSDGDDAIGELDDSDIGDYSVLLLDVDADEAATPHVDRAYSLNPRPNRPGLQYQVRIGDRSWTGLNGGSKGRGSIRYLPHGNSKVRVDSFVIPLAEIDRKPGDTVRFAYYGRSPKPDLTLNSVGFDANGKYYDHNLPLRSYYEWTLADRPATLDASTVPEGRDGP